MTVLLFTFPDIVIELLATGLGLIGGLKAAAEYEELIGRVAMASRGMDSQSLIHLAIIGFVLVGNVGYFAMRRRKRRLVEQGGEE